MTKICTKCKTEKNISLFYRNKYRTDGRQANCKVCHNKSTSTWRKNNPDKYSKYNKKRKKSPKKILASKMRSRKLRKNLSDSYIRDLATMNSNLNPEDLSNEFVETYRLNLKLKRLLKLTPKLKGEEGKP